MPNTYDEEIEHKILARKQRAAKLKAERQQERKKYIYIGSGVALVILLIIVLVSVVSCGKDKKEPEVTTAPIETTMSETTSVPETTAQRIMYTKDVLNLRKTASSKAEVVRQIAKGESVTVLDSDGTWCHVQYKKKQGYLMLEYLSDNN